MISNVVELKNLPIYGDGMQIRDWLHVKDHCSGIDTVLHKGRLGEVYNIGGNNEKANIEIVDLIIANVKEKLSNNQYNGGYSRENRVGRCKLFEDVSCAAYILIPKIMTIGIVNVFQVIQVKHENRCSFKRFRRLKPLIQRGIEGPPVQQIGQNIIITFMLYFQPFQRLNRHIPDDAENVHIVLYQLNFNPLALLVPGTEVVKFNGGTDQLTLMFV